MLKQAGDGMDFQLIVLVGYSLSLNSAWALAGHVVAFLCQRDNGLKQKKNAHRKKQKH